MLGAEELKMMFNTGGRDIFNISLRKAHHLNRGMATLAMTVVTLITIGRGGREGVVSEIFSTQEPFKMK